MLSNAFCPGLKDFNGFDGAVGSYGSLTCCCSAVGVDWEEVRVFIRDVRNWRVGGSEVEGVIMRLGFARLLFGYERWMRRWSLSFK